MSSHDPSESQMTKGLLDPRIDLQGYPADSDEANAIRDAALAYTVVHQHDALKKAYERLRLAFGGDLTEEMKADLRRHGIEPDDLEDDASSHGVPGQDSTASARRRAWTRDAALYERALSKPEIGADPQKQVSTYQGHRLENCLRANRHGVPSPARKFYRNVAEPATESAGKVVQFFNGRQRNPWLGRHRLDGHDSPPWTGSGGKVGLYRGLGSIFPYACNHVILSGRPAVNANPVGLRHTAPAGLANSPHPDIYICRVFPLVCIAVQGDGSVYPATPSAVFPHIACAEYL